MTGTARRVQAARGHLVRLVVVVAVLVGLALTGSFQCTDGMATAVPMAHGANSAAMAVSHVQEPVTAPGATDSGGLGGVLATCLVFLAAVVAAVAALRPGVSGRVVGLCRPVFVVVIRAFRPRALSLAELCLLRT